MSNAFIQATSRAIDRHGISAVYKVITEGAYNVDTGSVTNTETSYNIKMYLKHIKANQFNYPNMIGKDAGLFYILGYNLSFVPSASDLIVFQNKTYKVDSIQSHAANGEIVLYRVLAVV